VFVELSLGFGFELFIFFNYVCGQKESIFRFMIKIPFVLLVVYFCPFVKISLSYRTNGYCNVL
jgi:hypothetical protein